MDSKLNELTQKLYDEGLEKGRADAERMVADAREQAATAVKKAQEQAAEILQGAQREAEELHRNAMTELSLAAQQMVSKLKGTIREMAAARAIGTAPETAAIDPAFVKATLTSAMQNWRENASLTAMLPSEMQKELDEKFAATLQKPLELQFGGVDSGFRLAPKDGGYYIDFSEKAFDALLREYLRPKVDELLFKQ